MYSSGNLISYREEVRIMINISALRGRIAECGKSQADVAKAIGITPKTFYLKMEKGVFGSDEIETMIKYLDIKNPIEIFFAD